nr:hypothetical protein [Tanacetum cinerariifolium]
MDTCILPRESHKPVKKRSRTRKPFVCRPNGDALRKCILSGRNKPTTVLVQAIAVTDDSAAIPEHTTVETPMNMSPKNKAHFQAEKEVIHLILTGNGDEIYSTVDACQIAQEMWEAIERLQQAQRDKDMQNNLDLIEKYFKKIYKPTYNNLRTSSNSRNKNVDTTPRYKNDNQSGQSGNQRTMNVAEARENVGSPVVQQSGIQCFNCKKFEHFAKECRKPKRVKDSMYYKEKMLLYKQADNTCLVETDDSNVIPDSPDMCDDVIQNDQNDVESDDEHVALANLIDNLNLDVNENKKIQKQLKKENTTLAHELKECKTILA